MLRTRPLLRLLLAPAIRRGRGFARDERGVTIIEFGILAVPFFTIVFAILETTMIFLAGQVLDSAVQDASRLVRTGQAQAQSYNLAKFRTAICNSLFGLFDCSKLKIKVSVVSSFSAANMPPPTKSGAECTPVCDWTLVESFSPGSGSEVIMVQAYYKWPTIVHLPGFNFQNQPDGSRLLGAVRVFQNEPF